MTSTKAGLDLQAQFDMEHEHDRHIEKHITKEQLIDGNVLTEEMSELLEIIVKGESNLICGGLSGSGKTTIIRSLLKPYASKSDKQLVTVEKENMAMRLKSNDILFGETRGVEAYAAIEAMGTGHHAILTMHGFDARDIVNRLMTNFLMEKPSLDIKIAERTIGNSLDFICIQENIPQIGRRLTSIVEVVFDFEKQCIELKPIYSFNFLKKEFNLVNKISSGKAEELARRGVTSKELERWV